MAGHRRIGQLVVLDLWRPECQPIDDEAIRHLRENRSLLRVTDSGSPAAVARTFRKANALKLTIDSNEPIEQAMRVVGALYGVTLVASSAEQHATHADNGADRPATPKARKTTNRKSTKGKKPSAAKAAQPAAVAVEPDAQPERTTASRSVGAPSNVEVRAWARQNGFTVSDRGRVPASVMTAFRNAQDS